ncbi:MAG: Type IV pilus biogenesis [Rhodobacteraceae bacterium HLUCCA08]|nr:MAG: Type IV pilus biogenesis [Rhodobacteraceae bacterium HLUCCA08]
MSDDTNEFTAAAATVEAAVPLSETILIGVLSGPEGASALLRLASGDILRVAPGDDSRAGQVLAVGEDRVILRRPGGQQVLTLPGG